MKDRNKRLQLQIVFLLAFIFLGSVLELHAEGVAAAYIENSGVRTVLELRVADPAPTSIIVKQSLPAGVRVESASPRYSKFSGRKNMLTWLFKRPQPGKIRIVLRYKEALTAKGATAVIRCKSPSDGTLMTINVR